MWHWWWPQKQYLGLNLTKVANNLNEGSHKILLWKSLRNTKIKQKVMFMDMETQYHKDVGYSSVDLIGYQPESLFQ